MGLTLRDFKKHSELRLKYSVLATFNTNKDSDEEFIAIMEGRDLPIYVITYNVEIT